MMRKFELEQLEDLIEIIEDRQPFDTSLELRFCGNKGWHCDLRVNDLSTVGCMLGDILDHERVEERIPFGNDEKEDTNE